MKITDEIILTFPGLFNETLRKFGKRNAYAFVGEEPKTYESVYKEIRALIAFLEENGIHKGDKVAILSSNMPNWGIAFFSITFMGAVAVPILPDFSPVEIANVLDHSGAKAIFISNSLQGRLEGYKSDLLSFLVQMEDFSILSPGKDHQKFDPAVLSTKNYDIKEDDLASIIYTSGTTGRSKGVMLTHKNISFNALKGRAIQWIDENDRFLSVLPLSHTYENTLGLILPMLCGSCVYYLQETANSFSVAACSC